MKRSMAAKLGAMWKVAAFRHAVVSRVDAGAVVAAGGGGG